MRLTALSVLILTASTVIAQPKKDPPPKPVPGAPTLTTPASLGLMRGEKLELTLTGTNLAHATAVAVFGCEPSVTATIAKDQTDGTKLKVAFDVPDASPIGMFQLRVATVNGVSNYRPICIDCVPDVVDNGDNNKTEKAQKIEWPCVVTGTIAAESADYYRFSVKAGQVVNLDCHARRLGSPLDPVIILHDAKTGRELPALYADDTPGLQADARFVHQFKDDGEYLVQVRDSTYKGGADFAYRLRMTFSPALSVLYPPIATISEELQIVRETRLRLIEKYCPPRVILLNKDEPLWIYWSQIGGDDGWPIPLRPSTITQRIEVEPNDDISKADKLPLPAGVTATFDKKGDKDFFSFPAKKGQKIEAVCMTAEIGSPTEVHLRILDEKGKELAVSDPQKPAARAEFTAPEDGTYYAATEHLNYLFGPGEVYHLTIKPVLPDFEVVVGTDRIEILKDGIALMPITGIAKLNGFNGPVTLNAFGEKVLGELALPSGATPTKENPVYLPIRFKNGAKGITPFRVTAKSGDTSKPANATEITRAGLGGLSHLPPGWDHRFVAVEVPVAPITLGYIFENTIAIGKNGKVKIEVVRGTYDGDVTLSVLGLPANVAAKVKPIAKGEKSVDWEIAADAKAVPTTCDIYFKGVTKSEMGEQLIYVGPVKLTIIPAKKDEPKKEEPKKK